MSRIGKLPIVISETVTITLKEGGVEVAGPKGKLLISLSPQVEVTLSEDKKTLTVLAKNSDDKAIWGTTRALLANAVCGVSTEWQKTLEMVGVGYKAIVKGTILELAAGFSHLVKFEIPEGVTITVADNTKITVSGVSKQLVGLTAAKIRKVRKPEPYKGKGIKYSDEVIRRKAGKAGKAGASGAGGAK